MRPALASVPLALILVLGSGCGGGGTHGGASARSAASPHGARGHHRSHGHHSRGHARSGRSGGSLGGSILTALLSPVVESLITAPFRSRHDDDDALRPPTPCEEKLREWLEIHQDPHEQPPYHLRCGPHGEGPGARLQAAPAPRPHRFYSPL